MTQVSSVANHKGVENNTGSVQISAEQIAKRVAEMGAEIRAAGHPELHLICVLNGAFMFFADLVRAIEMPCTVDFIQVSSYEGTETTGNITFIKEPQFSIEGRHVILVEDIIDTGITMSYLLPHLKKQNPASLALASLLSKPSRRQREVLIDYLGFEIEDAYVFGYGLDRGQQDRHHPFIGSQQ